MSPVEKLYDGTALNGGPPNPEKCNGVMLSVL